MKLLAEHDSRCRPTAAIYGVGRRLWMMMMAGLVAAFAWPAAAESEPVFPGTTWQQKRPDDVGMDRAKLAQLSRFVGGRGCVVRHGYMVYRWGDASRRADVASACKPFYSYFLFKAIEDGKLKSVDEKVVRWQPRLGQINKDLGLKDREIRWRDFANSYSWLWWINGVDRHGVRMFPDAPTDLFGAFGHGGPRAMWVIPSLDMVVSYNDAKMRTWTSGEKNPTNTAMKLLVQAVVPTSGKQ